MYEFLSFLIEKGNFLYISGMAVLYYLYRRIRHYDKTYAAGHIAWSYPSSLLQQLHLVKWILLTALLLLQPTVGFGLSNNVLPFFSICHQLSPSSYSQHLKISFHLFLGIPLLLVPSSSWVKIFWASYPPPFSLGDLTSVSFDLLPILLYFLLFLSLLVLDSSDFSIPRFHT